MKCELRIPVTILKEGGRYVAYTPVFDISTSAPTFRKAKERFGELVELYLEELDRMGTLNRVLQDSGWRRVKKEWRAPVQVSHEMETICLPC